MCGPRNLRSRFASSTGSLLIFIAMLPLGQPAAGASFATAGASRSLPTLIWSGIPAPFAPPVATFREVWLEHNVRMRGRKGLVIHAHFIVTDRVKIKCRIEGYFYDATNNKQIPAAPGSPNTSSGGTAAVWRDINPGYASTEYKDFQIFVPTTTFHALPKGSHDLKVIVYVESENQVIGRSGENAFTLTL